MQPATLPRPSAYAIRRDVELGHLIDPSSNDCPEARMAFPIVEDVKDGAGAAESPVGVVIQTRSFARAERHVGLLPLSLKRDSSWAYSVFGPGPFFRTS